MPRRVVGTLRENLLECKESGMGYQLAKIEEGTRDGGVKKTWYLVFNAKVAFQIKESLIEQGEFWRPLQELLRQQADVTWLNDWPEPDPSIEKLKVLKGSVSEVKTHGSYLSTSRPGELFVRYSAFHPDLRIGRNGSVRSGTYVTTATDMPHVPSGLAAVGRYALPNPAPALYVYTMSPPPGISIRCGTVVPSFGQAGGGVEVQFTQPLPPNTAHGPILIPER